MAEVRIVDLTEWEARTFAEIQLDASDRQAWALISQPRVDIVELLNGIAISAKSWVGVLRLPTIEIRVRPKLSGDHLHLARMIDFACGSEGVHRLDAASGVSTSGDSLLDLIALLFVEAAESIVRQGLISDYIVREDCLPVVRGRILAHEQIRRRFGLADKVHCRYDEFEQNVLENQLILATVRAVSRRVESKTIHRRLERLRHVFESSCELSGFDRESARRSIDYNRLNAYYRGAHQLAWLLLDGIGVEDVIAGGQRSFAFFLDMNELFERFVWEWLQAVLPAQAYRVRSQAHVDSVIWDAAADEPYSKVIPDFLVDCLVDARTVPIDAKYKRYDAGAAESDIYQAFLYAWAFGAQNERHVPRTILMHPVEAAETRVTRLRIRSKMHRNEVEVVVFGLSISRAIDEIGRRSESTIGASLIGQLQGTRGLLAAAS